MLGLSILGRQLLGEFCERHAHIRVYQPPQFQIYAVGDPYPPRISSFPRIEHSFLDAFAKGNATSTNRFTRKARYIV
jgi:hypothetical protein